jgi:hypothetical protein
MGRGLKLAGSGLRGLSVSNKALITYIFLLIFELYIRVTPCCRAVAKFSLPCVTAAPYRVVTPSQLQTLLNIPAPRNASEAAPQQACVRGGAVSPARRGVILYLAEAKD